MTAVAARTRARRSHERRVDSLLQELRTRREHLYALQLRGARPPGLRALQAELRATHERLAATVDADHPPAGPAPPTGRAGGARGRDGRPRLDPCSATSTPAG